MPEIAEGTSTPEATTTTEAPAPVAAAAPPSVEDVEAIWQKRIAGKDRAHAAEVAELRRQLDALKNPAPAPVNETAEQRRIRELEEQIAEERRARVTETRKARFPKAAEYLGDAVNAADEGKLAGLEALLAGEEPAPAPVIAPTSPARQVAPRSNKTIEEMSKQELQDMLRQIGPAYQEYLQSTR